MSNLTQPLKWHGGKHYLARRIIDLMPRHIHYVEPFFGGGSVLLTRDPEDTRFWLSPHKGVSEVANDLDGRLTNFWRVLQDREQFGEFLRVVEAIPMSQVEWRFHHDCPRVPGIEGAVSFFVDARQSRSGLMTSFTSITRSRTRRLMNGNVSEWLGAVDGLADVHARLRRVLIECTSAMKLIPREDSKETFFYCDPPYVHDSRVSTDAYDFEMSDADHRELAAVLRSCKGKVMISGYHSPLYAELYDGWGWRRVSFDLPNNASGSRSKKRMIECLWMNY